jgi:hypothetical protein
MGNIAVVYNALGEIEDLKGIRKAVSNSTDLKCYEPKVNEVWENAYKEYVKIL